MGTTDYTDQQSVRDKITWNHLYYLVPQKAIINLRDCTILWRWRFFYSFDCISGV